MEKVEPVKVPRDVYEQLMAVREGSVVNMADLNGVQWTANQLELYALVVWCKDVRGKGILGRGVLAGFEPIDEEER